MSDLSIDFDFTAPASWDASMTDRLASLRENHPLFWSEQTQLWVAAGFPEVSYVSKHQELFTSEQGVRPKSDTIIGLLDEPEPRHKMLRRLINKGFTPSMVARLEEKFAEIARETLDGIADRGECDFVEEVAVPLPLLLIAEMIGIRREDREQFHRWSDALIDFDGNRNDPEVMARTAQAFVDFSRYVGEIIEERRLHPEDDLLSILVKAKDDGLLDKRFGGERALEGQPEEMQAATDDELVILLAILLVAGNETTRNAIAGGMQLLIENPGEREKLVDNPSLIPVAVEEMLRLVSPVQTFSRTVTRKTELAGKTLEVGDEVLLVYPSANRDARVFEEPDLFRVDRRPQHLAFGVGSHFCLGANLARMEMRVAFRQLLRRFPDMEYSRGGPELRPSAFVRACTHMWVQYTSEAVRTSTRRSFESVMQRSA